MITKKWDGQALILTCYLKTEAYIFPTCMKRLPLQPLIHSLLPLISAHIWAIFFYLQRKLWEDAIPLNFSDKFFTGFLCSMSSIWN